MSNEVSTEVDLIQRHTQSVAGLATQLGYDGTALLHKAIHEGFFSNIISR